MEPEVSLKVGDIVWGKVQGYPWWPGTIVAIPQQPKPTKGSKNSSKISVKSGHYHVRFIGHDSWSELPFDKVEIFSQSFDKYSQTKDKKLKDAITKAQQLINPTSKQEESKARLFAKIKPNQSEVSRKKAVEVIYDPEIVEEAIPCNSTKVTESEANNQKAATNLGVLRSKSTLFEVPVQLDPSIQILEPTTTVQQPLTPKKGLKNKHSQSESSPEAQASQKPTAQVCSLKLIAATRE